ncbi:hypothetical protein [Mesorhizobium sp. C280B]
MVSENGSEAAAFDGYVETVGGDNGASARFSQAPVTIAFRGDKGPGRMKR